MNVRLLLAGENSPFLLSPVLLAFSTLSAAAVGVSLPAVRDVPARSSGPSPARHGVPTAIILAIFGYPKTVVVSVAEPHIDPDRGVNKTVQHDPNLNLTQWTDSITPSFSRTALPIQQSRTFLAKLTRRSPATAERHSSPAPTTPVNPQTQAQAPPLQLTNLPYFVRRTPSNQLPVYLVTKAGGTKQQTKIQKTEGDLEALRSDLARALGLESGDSRNKSPDVTINRLNGHIIVKGWRKPEIQKFLLERNF
ncbi:54S ribosomal protein img2, mitochondrial [Paecilomyces lecythidis]